jgi:hypothetical protein
MPNHVSKSFQSSAQKIAPNTVDVRVSSSRCGFRIELAELPMKERMQHRPQVYITKWPGGGADGGRVVANPDITPKSRLDGSDRPTANSPGAQIEGAPQGVLVSCLGSDE